MRAFIHYMYECSNGKDLSQQLYAVYSYRGTDDIDARHFRNMLTDLDVMLMKDLRNLCLGNARTALQNLYRSQFLVHSLHANHERNLIVCC